MVVGWHFGVVVDGWLVKTLDADQGSAVAKELLLVNVGPPM